MKMSATKEKKDKIKKLCTIMKNQKKIKIRQFAKFIGYIISVCQATKYGWLHTKLFERQKYLALKTTRGNFDKYMNIPVMINSDFMWWINNINKEEKDLIPPTYTITVYTDASRVGWGAYCGTSTANGFWNPKEASNHINVLELKAAFYGLQSFAKNLKNCNILLRIDNTTSVSYINRMGGIKYASLNKQTRIIWEWCENKNLFIFASYISSKDNHIADQWSRSSYIETEYSLNNDILRNS